MHCFPLEIFQIETFPRVQQSVHASNHRCGPRDFFFVTLSLFMTKALFEFFFMASPRGKNITLLSSAPEKPPKNSGIVLGNICYYK